MTGKRKGSEITREQAAEILDAARAISRGERRLIESEGGWQVIEVVREEPPAGGAEDEENW